MVRIKTNVNRGGARPGAGRPKGSKTRTHLPRNALKGTRLDGKKRLENAGEFTEIQLAACKLLAEGLMPRAIEERIGVTTTTLCNWRHKPSFKQLLTKMRQEFLEGVKVIYPEWVGDNIMLKQLYDRALNGDFRALTYIIDKTGILQPVKQVRASKVTVSFGELPQEAATEVDQEKKEPLKLVQKVKRSKQA